MHCSSCAAHPWRLIIARREKTPKAIIRGGDVRKARSLSLSSGSSHQVIIRVCAHIMTMGQLKLQISIIPVRSGEHGKALQQRQQGVLGRGGWWVALMKEPSKAIIRGETY